MQKEICPIISQNSIEYYFDLPLLKSSSIICNMLDDFIIKNWFDLLQSAFIVGGFILSFFATRNDVRSRKVEYLLLINQSHREIWSKTYSNPELLRIRKNKIDLKSNPITAAEHRMVKEVIIHIYAVYEAIQNEQLDKGEMENDIADFLRLPIPNLVWQEVKVYHDKRFVAYMDALLSRGNRSKTIL